MKTFDFSFLSVGWFVISSLFFVSCNNSSSFREPQDAIDGYAIQERLEKWSIFNVDGKEAFEDKMIVDENGEEFNGERMSFKSRVSASVNGFYKLKGAKHDLYLLSKELSSENKVVYLGPYKYVGMFYEDIAPSVKEGEGIVYINRKGETVFDINECTGLNVRYAYNFMGGLSVIGISTETGVPLYGAINMKGEIVIEPTYLTLEYFGSGLYYAINSLKVQGNDDDEWDVDILDNTGKSMFTFKKKDYNIDNGNGSVSPFCFSFKDGYGVLNGSSLKWIIVNREGKELLKSDGTKRLVQKCRSGKYFAFIDEGTRFYGIMDVNGKIIIPAEYQTMAWLDKEMFCGAKDKNSMEVCDYSGKILFSRDFNKILPFNGDYSCVISQGECEFINTKGETLRTSACYSGFIFYDNELLNPVISDLNK